jgi:hypothetical protein
MCDLVYGAAASTTPDASQVAQRVPSAITMHPPFVRSFVPARAVASLRLSRGHELAGTP